MNEYELILLFDPGLGEEKIDQVLARTAEKIKAAGGEVEKTEKWGSRRLASTIKKARGLTQGYYVLMVFRSAPSLPAELRALLRVTESVVRYFFSRAVAASAPTSEKKTMAAVTVEAVDVGEIKGAPLGES